MSLRMAHLMVRAVFVAYQARGAKPPGLPAQAVELWSLSLGRPTHPFEEGCQDGRWRLTR